MKRRDLASLGAVSILLCGAAAGAQPPPAPTPPAPTAPAPTTAAPTTAAPTTAAPTTAAPTTAAPTAPVATEKPAPESAPAVAPKAEPVPPPADPATSTAEGAISILPGWKAQFYGFIEFDAMRDSTQSFNDSPGNNPILRSDGSSPAYRPTTTEPPSYAYGATHPRMLFSARNTRFGFKLAAPDVGGVKIGGLIETDFMGNQPANPYSKQGYVSNPNTPTETAFFSNAALRVRHAYIRVDNDIVDVLVGQYYQLFGMQPHFFPASVSYLGLPNQIFGRTPQLRLTKVIKTKPLNIEIAVAALRPAQADGRVPDVQAGIRFVVNPWKGAHGAGAGQATLDGLSVGVSGVYREFRVARYENNVGDPTTANDVAKARSIENLSVDAFIPVIPITSLEDKSNALSLTGSFVTGSALGDLYTGSLHGGAPFPRPAGASSDQGFYGANIDPGLVMYRLIGNGQEAEMFMIKRTSYMAGLQYFLPIARGKVILTGNYTHSESPNLYLTIAQGGDPARTFDKSDYYDVNLFIDWTRAFRTGLSWQRIRQCFRGGLIAGDDPMSSPTRQGGRFWEKNDRFEASAYLFF